VVGDRLEAYRPRHPRFHGEAADAARLLGTRTMLVGLRPELAQTIVGLGVDLSGLLTRAYLQSAVSEALRDGHNRR